MKFSIMILCVLLPFSILSQVTIDSTGRGGTRSITRTVENTKKIDIKALNVLFIGNELSAANSMHQVFQYIGAQVPKPYKITSASLFGKGFSFKEHNERTNLPKVYEKFKWQYAVIQGSPQEALDNPEEYKAQAISFIEKLQELNTKVIILMPWAKNYSTDDSKKLFSIHQNLAKLTSSLLAPAGTAFTVAKKNEPKLNLYLEDGLLPTPQGSYLTAAVLATSLTGQTTIGQKQFGLKSVTSAQGLYLQKVATKVCKDYANYLKRQKK